MDIIAQLAKELNIKTQQAQAAVQLIDEGNTIPFIARYRKEMTGSLNDEVLRNLDERLKYLRNLEERKGQVLETIREQGALTKELEEQILAAGTLVLVEDLYRPYRPKRRTRATAAKEKGLEPLADVLMLQMLEYPALAEAEAVSRILKIAACVDIPVIIVHLSSREGYEEICRARKRGQQVFVETCPQYLLMDKSRYDLPDDEARKYMIAPPLREKEDQKVLWEALAEGKIQTIATDHCSFTTSQKRAGEEDFSKTPCGMPGAEERPGLVYQFGVRQGKITLEQMCGYLSENPAKLYGLYPAKGVIAAGSDGDIVVWDPNKEWTLSAKSQQSRSDYCPLEGTRLVGRAKQVYLRGTLAAENGKILRPCAGKYVTAH